MSDYPQLTKLFGMISADNGGCTVDEFEQLLESCSDPMLETLAAGEDTERKAVLAELIELAQGNFGQPEKLVEMLDEFLNKAFDA